MKWVTAFCCFFAAVVAVPLGHADIALSANETAALARGEIVTRANTEDHLGGTGYLIIHAPPWKVWQVITDYPKYPEFMPRNVGAKLLKLDGDAVLLETQYRSSWPMPNIWSQSRLQKDTTNSDLLVLRWKAEKTNLKLNLGSWTLQTLQDSTLVTYQNSFEIAWVPQQLAKNSSRKSIARILEAVQARVTLPRYSEHPDQLTELWRIEEHAIPQH